MGFDTKRKRKMGEEVTFNLTPLMNAVITRNFESLKDLIENQGANVNEQDKYGDSALHAAAKCDYGFVEYLLSKNASPNIQNNTGSTPLHKAAACGQYEAVELLLLSKADPNLPNTSGILPDHLTTDKVVMSKLLGDSLCKEIVRINKQKHAQVMGKRGATVRRVQFETHTVIKVPQSTSMAEEIQIFGRKEDVAKAKEEVLNIANPRKISPEDEFRGKAHVKDLVFVVGDIEDIQEATKRIHELVKRNPQQFKQNKSKPKTSSKPRNQPTKVTNSLPLTRS